MNNITQSDVRSVLHLPLPGNGLTTTPWQYTQTHHIMIHTKEHCFNTQHCSNVQLYESWSSNRSSIVLHNWICSTWLLYRTMSPLAPSPWSVRFSKIARPYRARQLDGLQCSTKYTEGSMVWMSNFPCFPSHGRRHVNHYTIFDFVLMILDFLIICPLLYPLILAFAAAYAVLRLLVSSSL